MVVKIHQFKLKLKTNFSISHGDYSYRDSIIVELAANNQSGYGETVVIDYYGIDKNDLLEKMHFMANQIKDWSIHQSPQDFYVFLSSQLPNSPFVHVAFDTAYWDLKSRIERLPLHQYIPSNSLQKEVLSSMTIGINEDESSLRNKLKEDWPIIKLKMKGKTNLDIITRIKKAVKSFGIDTNGSWDQSTWNELVPILEEQECLYIEQPFSKANEACLAELKSSCNLPILADESVTSTQELFSKLDLYDGFVLKLVKCGGITPVLEMIQIAKKHNKLLLAGCMTESSVGISNMYALLNCFDFADLDGSQLINNDPFNGVVLQNDGTFQPAIGYGNGVKPII